MIIEEFKKRHPDIRKLSLTEDSKGYVIELRQMKDSIVYKTASLSGRNLMGILERLYSSFAW